MKESPGVWIDFDLFGHQIVAHLAPKNINSSNPVDGQNVPIPHFGCVLEWSAYDLFRKKILEAKVTLEIDYLRFEGSVGEQSICD